MTPDKQPTMDDLVKPPFPEMTFKEMLTNLFNLDFMTPEEQQTIFDAGEMYANGCLKQASLQTAPLIEEINEYSRNLKNSVDQGGKTIHHLFKAQQRIAELEKGLENAANELYTKAAEIEALKKERENIFNLAEIRRKQIDKLILELGPITDLLDRLEDYMDNKSDVDFEDHWLRPNKEMVFCVEIREVIKTLSPRCD